MFTISLMVLLLMLVESLLRECKRMFGPMKSAVSSFINANLLSTYFQALGGHFKSRHHKMEFYFCFKLFDYSTKKKSANERENQIAEIQVSCEPHLNIWLINLRYIRFFFFFALKFIFEEA